MLLVFLDKDEVVSTQGKRTSTPFDFPLPDELSGKLKKVLKTLKPSRVKATFQDTLSKSKSSSGGGSDSLAIKHETLWACFLTFFVNLWSQCDWRLLLAPVTGSQAQVDWNRFIASVEEKQPQMYSFLKRLEDAQMVQHFLAEQLKQVKKYQITNANGTSGLPPMVSLLKQPGVDNPTSFSGVMRALRTQGVLNQNVIKAVGSAAAETTSNQSPKSPLRIPAVLNGLQTASYDLRVCHTIFSCVLTRFQDARGRNWKHGSKALTLLYHLVTGGSESVLVWVCSPEVLRWVHQFTSYTHGDDGVQQKIRAQAAELLALLGNWFNLRLRVPPADPTRTSQQDISKTKTFSFATHRDYSLTRGNVPVFPEFQTLHSSLLEPFSTSTSISDHQNTSSSSSSVTSTPSDVKSSSTPVSALADWNPFMEGETNGGVNGIGTSAKALEEAEQWFTLANNGNDAFANSKVSGSSSTTTATPALTANDDDSAWNPFSVSSNSISPSNPSVSMEPASSSASVGGFDPFATASQADPFASGIRSNDEVKKAQQEGLSDFFGSLNKTQTTTGTHGGQMTQVSNDQSGQAGLSSDINVMSLFENPPTSTGGPHLNTSASDVSASSQLQGVSFQMNNQSTKQHDPFAALNMFGKP